MSLSGTWPPDVMVAVATPGAAALEALGLGQVEVAVYEELVGRPAATVAQLRQVPHLDESRVRGALGNLARKGLVRRMPGRPITYEALPPDDALSLLIRRREDVLGAARRVAEDLGARYRDARLGRPAAELTEVVTGDREVNRRYDMLLRTAREQLRIMTRPPFHTSALRDNRDMTNDLHTRRLHIRNIIDARSIEHWGLDAFRQDLAWGEQYRALARVPLKLSVVDERVGFITLEMPPRGRLSAMLVQESALLDSLIETFDVLWELAAPLDILGAVNAPSATSRFNEADRTLIGLLAAGVPDDVIAKRLDISSSTLHRRIQLLKLRLGAASRFQAGWQAHNLSDQSD